MVVMAAALLASIAVVPCYTTDGLTGMPCTSYYAPSSTVPFLEHSLVANGTVISGSVPFRSVNFPSYWFNENTRQLNGEIDFEVNDSLALIFGDGLTLKGNFGAGTGNRLYGVYSLPVKADQAQILSVDRFGTIGMYVNGRTLFLRPGEQYVYREREKLKERDGEVNVVYEHRYLNRGPIDKSAICARMVA